jgi:hypothetical protein
MDGDEEGRNQERERGEGEPFLYATMMPSFLDDGEGFVQGGECVRYTS